MNKFLSSLHRGFRVLTGTISIRGWLMIGSFLITMFIILSVLSMCTRDDNVSRAEVARDQKAREQAADSRLADARQQDQMKEALNEAVAQLPESVPSDRRLALACQRLRNDGHTSLPTSCGPAPYSQAPPRPG